MRICYVSSNTGAHTDRFLEKMKNRHEIHFVSFKGISEEFQNKHPSVYFYSVNLPFPRISIVTVPSIIKSFFF